MKSLYQNLEVSIRSRLITKEMKSLHRFIFSFCLVLVSFTNAFSRELPHHEITANENDYALRKALLDGNMEEFEHYLSLGANPTEWLDYTHDGWVFCAATAVGREQFLRKLIDKGYDVNFPPSRY